ncbi:MAG TPA: DUF433 domain-containing protein [Chloroflexota bacterium]|nr:DUF433 domain-containing protein [Chloroflexota bacterium]
MTNGRIVVDPRVMAGKPVVRGTRIPVDLVLKRLFQDLDLRSPFESYPRLTDDDVKACLAYASAPVQGEDVFPERVILFRNGNEAIPPKIRCLDHILEAYGDRLRELIVVNDRGVRVRGRQAE